MKRIALFLATNIAVLVILSITLRLVGFTGFLDQQGVELNIRAVLLFAVLLGFGGAFFAVDFKVECQTLNGYIDHSKTEQQRGAMACANGTQAGKRS